jgi:hypothetical protein
MRRSATTFLLMCFTLGIVLVAPARGAVQSKCLAKKNGCVAKLGAGLLKCEQLARAPGKPADPNAKDCVTKAAAKFTGGVDPAKGCFAKLEAKDGNDCVVTVNASAAEAAAAACVADIVAAIDPAPLDQTDCGVGKEKCATKRLTGLLKCWAKAETPNKPTDPNANDCVTKVAAKFEGAVPAKGCFAKLEDEDGNDCAPPVANAAAVASVVDDCVSSLVAVLETPPVCTPGAVQSCYTGPAGTQGVGICTAGQQVCQPSGLGWEACVGDVTPQTDICGNAIDEDCDGGVDPLDADGDGWNSCQNDCCDRLADGCGSPALVNPGALEIVGNGVDDDCDATTSDVTPAAACSVSQKLTALTAIDLAGAMDLCRTTTANPPLSAKKWGIVSATFLQPNGAGFAAGDLANVQSLQAAVLTGFGNVIVPANGTTLAGISSGRMRDAGDAGFVSPISGSDFGRALSFPTAGPLGSRSARQQSAGGIVRRDDLSDRRAGQRRGAVAADGAGSDERAATVVQVPVLLVGISDVPMHAVQRLLPHPAVLGRAWHPQRQEHRHRRRRGSGDGEQRVVPHALPRKRQELQHLSRRGRPARRNGVRCRVRRGYGLGDGRRARRSRRDADTRLHALRRRRRHLRHLGAPRRFPLGHGAVTTRRPSHWERLIWGRAW